MSDVTEGTVEQLQRLAADLQDLGYRGQVADDRVSSSITGYEVEIFLFPNRTLQFSTGFQIDDGSFGLAEVNAFNASYRFGRTFIDEDEDVILVSDFLYDAEDDGRISQLKRMLLLHEVSLGFLTGAFDRADEAAQSRAGEQGGDEGPRDA